MNWSLSRQLGILWIACFLTAAFVQNGQADILENGPFKVEAVVIGPFSGQLTIAVQTHGDVTVRAEGSAEQLEKMTVTESGGQLAIRGPKTTVTSSSTTIVSNNTVIVGDGGRAQITIDGVDVTKDAEDPVVLEVIVPAGTRVDMREFVGDAVIGDILAPLHVELLSGEVRAGQIADGDLIVQGAGNVHVASIDGQLGMVVNGSGSIAVESGRANGLNGEVNGSGSLHFGGHAETASVSVNGVGTVNVAHVDRRPHTAINGIGSVEFGNWR